MTKAQTQSLSVRPCLQLAIIPTFPFSIPPFSVPSAALVSINPSLSHQSNILSLPVNVNDDVDVVHVTSSAPCGVTTQICPTRINRRCRKEAAREIQQESRMESGDSCRRKRYQEKELRDLIRFRLEMQSKFEKLNSHQALWTDIGGKMVANGHHRRHWSSYREKWGSEIQRYQKEKEKLGQSDFDSSNEGDVSSLLIFEDEILNDIHRIMHRKSKICSPHEDGPSRVREPSCSEETEEVSEPGGKRFKKSSSSQSASEKGLDLSEALERIEKMDVMGSSENWKDVLTGISSFTRNMVGASRTATSSYEEETELTPDKRVDDWLQSIGREKYARHFLKMGVDWMSIMHLQEVDIIERSGMPIAISRHIWAELQKLRLKRGS